MIRVQLKNVSRLHSLWCITSIFSTNACADVYTKWRQWLWKGSAGALESHAGWIAISVRCARRSRLSFPKNYSDFAQEQSTTNFALMHNMLKTRAFLGHDKRQLALSKSVTLNMLSKLGYRCRRQSTSFSSMRWVPVIWYYFARANVTCNRHRKASCCICGTTWESTRLLLRKGQWPCVRLSKWSSYFDSSHLMATWWLPTKLRQSHQTKRARTGLLFYAVHGCRLGRAQLNFQIWYVVRRYSQLHKKTTRSAPSPCFDVNSLPLYISITYFFLVLHV